MKDHTLAEYHERKESTVSLTLPRKPLNTRQATVAKWVHLVSPNLEGFGLQLRSIIGIWSIQRLGQSAGNTSHLDDLATRSRR